jgi:hypothetical protein
MFVIKQQKAGEYCLDHGRKFTSREKAVLWLQRECLNETGHFYNRGHDYKIEYQGYPDDIAELDAFVVYWEAQPERNEFGLVLP